MHVVMLSDLETVGGAAISASRLAEGLVRSGTRVTRLVSHPSDGTHPWRTRQLGNRIRDRVVWRPLRDIAQDRSLTIALWAERFGVRRDLRRMLRAVSPDVIQVHNIAYAAWWPTMVETCALKAPTVWTLHDMWSFTGRCGYSEDCIKFRSGCDASCPTPDEYPALTPHLIAEAWRLRRRVLQDLPKLVATSPSRWLAREAESGIWKGHRIEVIPYGVPLDVYRPIARSVAREALGLDTTAPVLGFSAHSLSQRRKGGALLLEAIRRMDRRPLALLTWGGGEFPAAPDGIRVYSMGSVDHARTQAICYNALDVIVHPAIADNLPNTVLEALACGTPAVGFPVGGIPELIRPGQTGWLAPFTTPEALAETLDEAVRDLRSGTDLRSSCRAIAETEFSLELQAQRYLDLFRSLRKSGTGTAH